MAYLILQEEVISSIPGGADFATIDSRNVLDDAATESWTGRCIFWSGWIGESIFGRDVRSWGKDAWSRLDRWCNAALPSLSRTGGTACFRPHPRHILSDPQSCVSFLKRRAGQPFELLLEPVAFLTPAMLDRAEDHIRRALDALADHDAVPGIVITNARLEHEGDDLLTPSPADQGLIEPRLMHLIAAAIPAHKARIIVGPDAERQAHFLSSAR